MAKRTRRAASSAVRATSGASRNKVEKTKKAEKSTAKKGKGSPAKKDKAGAKTLEWPPSTAIEALSTQDQFKMVSWNVAGLRACIKKGFSEYVEKEQPDILCLNEVRCAKEDPDVAASSALQEYPYQYWSVATSKKGYAGVTIASKLEPLDCVYYFDDEHREVCEGEGRYVRLEFAGFYLIAVYIPNAGRGLTRLEYRLKWDSSFLQHLCELQKKKPVIVTGDMNVAHTPRDLANAQGNKRSSGFTWEERQNFDKMVGLATIGEDGEELVDWSKAEYGEIGKLETGPRLVDIYRHFYPDRSTAFTYWTYMAGARGRNIGWRIDYFLASKLLLPHVHAVEHRHGVAGSDHCPILLTANRASLVE
mmetsp:Transcript_5276/g.11763  ORF Transcript_5276/g.11763 Transcript_5276/m.11763 type:complete len:363 (+) Transcript_5276:165-1253(+)